MDHRFLVTGAVLSFLFCATAAADVVDAPPDDCPDGTMGSTCHGGPHCRARTCTVDSECTDGTVCQPRTQCIERLDCGGLRPPDADPADFETDIVRGTCPGSCMGECRMQSVCVARASTSTGGGGGCGCSVPGRSSGAASVALAVGAALAGIAFVALASRRRRR